MSVRQPRGLTDITCRLDTARAHRLCLEAPAVSNGSRYILAASDCTYEMPTHRLSSMIGRLYPHLPRVGGEEMSEDGSPVVGTPDIMRAYCLRAKEELGLQTYRCALISVYCSRHPRAYLAASEWQLDLRWSVGVAASRRRCGRTVTPTLRWAWSSHIVRWRSSE